MGAPARYHRITPKELYDWMHWHGLTQADMARGIGYSRNTVWRWLEGDYRTPASLYDELCQKYGEPYVPEYKREAGHMVGWGGRKLWQPPQEHDPED